MEAEKGNFVDSATCNPHPARCGMRVAESNEIALLGFHRCMSAIIFIIIKDLCIDF